MGSQRPSLAPGLLGRFALVGVLLGTLVASTVGVDAATTRSSVVTRIGAGAARMTVWSDGTGSLYVNLKALAPGRWNEHLYSGTCASLGTRVAVMPGLLVPTAGSLARTNRLTAAQARGKTLRLVSRGQVLCATFQTDLAPTGPAEAAAVVRVVDGDTIVVDRGHGEETLRYLGLDTPETVHPSEPVEWMGREAAEANRQLVEGRSVVLERDVSDSDHYGRLLRHVWIRDGEVWTLVNLALVAGGFAQVVTYPPDVKYVDLYLAAQQEARDQGKGLWGEPPESAPPPSASAGCDPSYPTVCIAPAPPDLDCGAIPFRQFVVLPPDPHRLDEDDDGIGCES